MNEKYENCYIAFLDLLGFKELVKTHTCEQILKIFDEIKSQYMITRDEDKKPLVDPKKIHFKIMSDSICFYVSSHISNSLPVLISLCAYFQVRLWRLEHPILVRGGIVKGDIYANDDIMFGTGLTNAYLLEEKNAKVPRIIITKETAETCNADESAKTYMQGFLLRDSDGFYYVDSLAMFYVWGQKNKSYIKFYNYVQHILDSTTDESIRSKYLYLEAKIQEMPYRVKLGEENICQNNQQP
ncbi:hypothetical protein DW194_17090 [Subdoligranulum sp. AM16-9]|nr:hypothetical protein DW194_17090 [Subdoligranulum sp. AM16-9]